MQYKYALCVKVIDNQDEYGNEERNLNGPIIVAMDYFMEWFFSIQ